MKSASPRQIDICKKAAMQRYAQEGIPQELAIQLFDHTISKTAQFKSLVDKVKPYATPENIGMAVGGIGGGLIGASSKKNKLRNALLGLGIGTGLGYGAGSMVDYYKQLTQPKPPTGIEVGDSAITDLGPREMDKAVNNEYGAALAATE